jgi:hypothetical protein
MSGLGPPQWDLARYFLTGMLYVGRHGIRRQAQRVAAVDSCRRATPPGP